MERMMNWDKIQVHFQSSSKDLAYVHHILCEAPQQNGVAERRNKILMDMVRSMMSNSSLPKSL